MGGLYILIYNYLPEMLVSEKCRQKILSDAPVVQCVDGVLACFVS